MSHVFHQLYYHFAWGTRSRQSLVAPDKKVDLLRFMAEEVAKRGGILIRQNALPDYAHLLVRLNPNILVSDFIGKVKGGTTYRYNREASIEARLARRMWRGDVARRRSGEGIEIHR